MDSRAFVVALGLTLLTLGCGPRVDQDTSASGSGGSTGSSGPESTAEASTASPDTDGEVCPELLDGPIPNLVIPIEITNNLATAVYVGYQSKCFADLFRISRADGSAVNWHGRFCTPSCEAVMADECFDCGPCPENTMLRIGPGATYSYGWTPTGFELLDFPAECAQRACSMTCDRRYALDDGEYTFELVAATACDGDGMTCDCGAGQDTCEVYPWSWPEATHSASAQVSSSAGTVSLTIE